MATTVASVASVGDGKFTEDQIKEIERIVDDRIEDYDSRLQEQLTELQKEAVREAKRASDRASPDMDLHMRAEKRFLENQVLDVKQPDSKLVVKRVEVDKKTMEFSEERLDADFMG